MEVPCTARAPCAVKVPHSVPDHARGVERAERLRSRRRASSGGLDDNDSGGDDHDPQLTTDDGR